MGKAKRWAIRIGVGVATFLIIRAIVEALAKVGLPLVDWLAHLLGGFLHADVLLWLVPGILALAGVVGFTWWEKRESQKAEPKAKTQRDVPASLLDLFKSDFSGTMKMTNKVTAATADGTSTTYVQQIYQDYSTNTEFAGYYFPRSPIAFDLINWLATNYRTEYDKLRSGLQVSMKSPLDLASVSNETLTFTGRVYVYHEDELTLRQVADLTDLYKAHGMHLMLRGPSYATQAWLQKKLK